MIALGWTWPGETAPAPLGTVDFPGCAAVIAAEAAGAAARLALQVACVRSLPAFLPFPPGRAVGLPEASDAAHRNAAGIAARLAGLAGCAQVTLRAEVLRQRTGSSEAGADWLRARAALLAEEEARGCGIVEAIRDVLGAWARGAPVIRKGPGAVEAHALVSLAAIDEGLPDIARDFGRCDALRGAQVSVTGPWPALAFSGPAGPAP